MLILEVRPVNVWILWTFLVYLLLRKKKSLCHWPMPLCWFNYCYTEATELHKFVQNLIHVVNLKGNKLMGETLTGASCIKVQFVLKAQLFSSYLFHFILKWSCTYTHTHRLKLQVEFRSDTLIPCFQLQDWA